MLFVRLVFILVNILALSLATYKFTNIKCQNFDPTFATFSKCELKLIKRDTPALNIYIKLLRLPVANILVLASLNKKANGYKPFLYNVTINFCDFLKNRKKYPVMNFFSDPLIKHSNLNHTCPYNHDVFVKNFVLTDTMYKQLPMPEGEYMIDVMVYVYNDLKVNIKYYLEYLKKKINKNFI